MVEVMKIISFWIIGAISFVFILGTALSSMVLA